jgi:N-methylhydantoinase B
VDQFRFNNVQPGGAGRYRGGFGLVRDYRLLCAEADLTTTFGRFKYPPWGAGGGSDGSANAVEIIPNGATKAVLRRGKLTRYRLRRNDVARLITGVGGGYGNPLERDPDLVREDVRQEYFTIAQAADIYGVVIDPLNLVIDAQATRALRDNHPSRAEEP